MTLDKSQGIIRVITIPSEGHIHACNNFHNNPSKGCWDISLQTKNFNLTVALKEKSVDHQVNYQNNTVRKSKDD